MTHPRRILTATNRAQALRMRADGESFADIADTLGLASGKVAANMVRAALRQLPTTFDLGEERDLAALRLDSVYQRLADGRLDPATGSAMIRALTARSSLLGLKVPEQSKVEHTGEVDHVHTHTVEGPLSAVEALDAVDSLNRIMSAVAGQHAGAEVERRLAEREQERLALAQGDVDVQEGELVEDRT